MKKIIAGILCLVMGISLVACGSQGASVDTDNPSAQAKAWLEQQIKDNTLFSFDYNGKAYADHIKSWNKTVEQTESGWTVTYKKDDVVAWSEIRFDEEFAALEWTNYFKNEGSADSPVISNILALNSTVAIESPILTTAKGSNNQPDDFEPITVDLSARNYSTASDGGRSSNVAFPYFDVCNGEYGIMAAIGWTGNWKAEFSHEDGVVNISAGMQKTNISLYAGEQMRTPMILLQFFVGDQADGHNAFRRLVLKSYTPTDETGEPVRELPSFYSVLVFKDEADLLQKVKNKMDKVPEFDGLWLDAVWYGGITEDHIISDNYWKTQNGNWYANPDRFTENLSHIHEWFEQENLQLLIWFEPECVTAGTQIATEHPEWLLSGLDQKWAEVYLFDLTKDEACDYLIEYISNVLKSYNIDWYRQDFNTNPELAWELADSSDTRVGISEIKYITNLYRYLDELVERNPGLMIDNCSSGGRRLDLEMTRRSIPYWRTDVSAHDRSSADSLRSINMNLTWWLPLHAGGYPQYNGVNFAYNMRSILSTGFTHSDQGNEGALQDMLEERNICVDMMYADYYMLSYGVGDEVSAVNATYQFNVPEQDKGFVLTFRPPLSDEESSTYLLRGLDADATYKIEVSDTGDVMTLTGAELMSDGLTIKYPKVGLSLLIYYNKVS